MITEYIAAALAKAKYEIIDDEEPYYGEVSELQEDLVRGLRRFGFKGPYRGGKIRTWLRMI